MKQRLALFVILSSTLAGCASVTGPSTKPSQVAPTAAATAAASQSGAPAADIVMCTLVPLGDVQAKSPFQTPLGVATPDVVPAGCTYTQAADAEEPVSVGLVVSTFDSAANAITVLHNDRQAIVARGLAVSDISGLGDEAFSYGTDEVGVRAVVGARYVEAHFKGEWPDTPDDAKVVAGTELVRLIISRLP